MVIIVGTLDEIFADYCIYRLRSFLITFQKHFALRKKVPSSSHLQNLGFESEGHFVRRVNKIGKKETLPHKVVLIFYFSQIFAF